MDILQRIYCNLKRQVATLPANITKSIESVNKSMNQVRIPPLTKDNVLFYYIPIQGLVSYSTLSVGVMNPHLMVRQGVARNDSHSVQYIAEVDASRIELHLASHWLFPRRDITDVLFLSAGSGAALWLWARPHIAAAAPARRFSWAFLGGCLWPLGSIFLWAILRSSIGQRPVLGTVLGVTTGAMLTNIAIDYFNYVELMFCGEVRLPEDTYSPNSDDEKYDIDL